VPPEFIDDAPAALWAAAIPLGQPAAQPIADWCARKMRLPLAKLPPLAALRALRRGDEELWLAAIMYVINEGSLVRSGLFLMLPDTPVTEVVGAPGVIPLTRPTRGDRAYGNAVIVVGLAYALAIADRRDATIGHVLAVPDAETLRAIVELPSSIRCVVIADPGGDASFGDGPTIERTARRLRQLGRRVRVVRGGELVGLG
jgi:hypothetical protein